MKIRTLIAAIAISLTSQVNAQWDTLSTGYNLKYEAIDFKDANNGVLIGNDISGVGAGYILITTDGGNNWSNPLGYQLERHDVDYSPNGNFWVVGDSGRVIYLGWPSSGYIFQGYLTQYDLYCGYTVNDSAFFCAGESGVLYSTFNSGLTWDTLSSGTGENVNDIYFSDAANGWIVADGGYLATTNDSGNTWTFVQQSLWGFYDFNGFAYQGSSGLNPYIVGEFGQGQFSVDNGDNWYSFTTNTVTDLNKIRFGTTLGGVICGNNGFISRSIDGGGSWFTETAPRNANLLDIAFAGDTTAYICGDSGVVLKSTVDISGIDNNSFSYFGASAFPNPFVQSLTVSILAEENTSANLVIADVTGKTVLTQNCSNLAQGVNRVEIGGAEYLAPGMYFITVISDAGNITLPVMKQ